MERRYAAGRLPSHMGGVDGPSPCDQPSASGDKLLAASKRRFAERFPQSAVSIKQAAFDRAVRLMQSSRSQAFRLEEESEQLREAYGHHQFGQSCCSHAVW